MSGPEEGAPLRTFRRLVPGNDIIQLAIRLGLLACLIYWTLVIVRPFVPVMAWSVVLAVALYPVFNWLAKLLGGRPRLAALILTVVNLGIVIGPAAWLGLSAVEGARELAGQLSAGTLVVPSPPESIKNWTLVGPPIYEMWAVASANVRKALSEVAPYLKPLAGTVLVLAGDADMGALMFLVSVVVAGVLFPHGLKLAAASRNFLAHIVPEQSEHFLALAAITIRSVSQGVIGIAIVQALLAGIVFKLAGVAGAGLLAFAVLLLAIVQIGASLVLLPVIIWLWATKDVTTALLLTIILVAIGLLDNLLKPLVMGRRLTTPTLVILIGVVGGTLAHGIVGLFIGPIVLSVAWELMVAWLRQDEPAATVSAKSWLPVSPRLDEHLDH
jgi:predicted PurR-regulated permease PerM